MATRYPSRLVLVSLSLALLSLAACAAGPEETLGPPPGGADQGSSAMAKTPAAPASQPPAAKVPGARGDDADPAAAAARVAAAERALGLARAKLEKSRADLATQEAAGSESVTAAGADRDLAQRALANFETTSSLRLERERMNVQNATDSFTEAEEELQQLELMYEKTELADKTKELVIRRGKRRLERSKRSLDLQRQGLANLEGIDLVQERAKLHLDADAKARALAKATRDAAATLVDKKLALQAQENDVAKLEDDLAAAQRAAQKSARAESK